VCVCTHKSGVCVCWGGREKGRERESESDSLETMSVSASGGAVCYYGCHMYCTISPENGACFPVAIRAPLLLNWG
jgi:hypothetical protein